MVIYTGPKQDQTSQHSNMDVRGAHRFPPVAEEQLRVDGFWGKEGKFHFPYGCGSW